MKQPVYKQHGIDAISSIIYFKINVFTWIQTNLKHPKH